MPDDFKKIAEVTIYAFENHPICQNTEHFIINALRRAVALTLSLVAEIDGQIVDHIVFLPETMSFCYKCPKGEVGFHPAFAATE